MFFKIPLYAKTLKILYRFSPLKWFRIWNWCKWRFNCFLKGTVLLTVVSPGVQLRCSIHICWLPNELQKEVFSRKEKSAPHPDCSVSRKVWLVPIVRKEKYSPFLIQVTSTGKSKWKSNSGNLIKTKVGFPITCLSPHQAPRLNNKFFYLLEKTSIDWPDWLVGIPAISTT